MKINKPKEFTVVIEKDADGYFIGTVPELHGCHTQARTQAILMKRIKEAIELCLEVESEGFGYTELVGFQRVVVEA